jgi:hypothetical protein
MQAQRQADAAAPSLHASLSTACRVFAKDVGRGLLMVSRNTLALLGLAVIGAALLGLGRPDVRERVEAFAFDWLHERQSSRDVAPADGVAAVVETVESNALTDSAAAPALALAAQPTQLTDQQEALAQWISRRYRVAQAPIEGLVEAAWAVGERAKLDPTLILAIMAVESSFNPFAQSSVGAQGLMQVMTRVHDKKYEAFGGTQAAFDPLSNLRVGVQVLQECIARAGGLYDGLRHYVGAANLPSDGGYAGKVLGEREHLMRVLAGKNVPHTAAIVPVAAPAKPVPADVAARPSQEAASKPVDATHLPSVQPDRADTHAPALDAEGTTADASAPSVHLASAR